MLRYLLDEQISSVVATGVARKNREILIVSVHKWRDGEMRASSDGDLLKAAAEEKLTLVTYDVHIIPEVLVNWSETGIDHTGVIFVDDRAIPSNNFGCLARSLIRFWALNRKVDWRNRISFLPRRES